MNSQIRTWIIQRSKLEWNPQPLTRPAADADLRSLTGPQRVIESIRFFIFVTEYWISADGVLREWLRVMCKLGILIIFPLVIFMPTVTFALWQVALWVALLVAITKSLILFPLAAIAVITLCGTVVIIVRSLFGR